MTDTDTAAEGTSEPADSGTDNDGNDSPAKVKKIALPYVDNFRAIFLTVLINLAVVFVFFWPNGVTFNDILLDSFICVVITVFIDVVVVYTHLKKLRQEGNMPRHVPVSRLMQKLPKNPLALGIIYIMVFAPLAVGSIAVVLWFYELETMAFVPWMSFKLIFAVITSVIVTDYCIFRYVQPDWAHAYGTSDGPQNFKGRVRNPLPKINVLKEMYGSITGYIALNLAKGYILGRIIIEADKSLLIHPYTTEGLLGLHLTGLTFGFVIGFLVTNGVMRKMNRIIRETGTSMIDGAESDRRLTWMPVKRFSLVLFMSIGMSLFSFMVLWGALDVFGITELNFFQFIALVSAYAIIMGRPLSYLVTQRCMQQDYIRYTLEDNKRGFVNRLFEKYL